MPVKHIYCFAFYDMSAPSVRYRIKYPLDLLYTEQGISYDLIHPGYDFKNMRKFLWVFLSALLFRKRNSLIIFQKIYTKGLYANALKMLLFFRPKKTFYDIDDAEYIRFEPNTVQHFMKHCETCTVGSETLKNYALQHNANVILLTSPVIAHQEIKTSRNALFTIGWIGFYSGHKDNLHSITFPAINTLKEPVKLVILGVRKAAHRQEIRDYFASNENIQIEIPEDIDWLDELSVYRQIKTFDVGISPLLDNEFNRAKSAFKLKQYLSAGVPALCSPIGENIHFLDEGKNGFFCDSPEAYTRAILKIKNMNDEQYQLLCKNTRSDLNRFSVRQYAMDLIMNTNSKSHK